MSLKVDYAIFDYGDLQYEYSDAKTVYDQPVKEKRGIAPVLIKIYLILVAAGMLGWFLYSIIAQSLNVGFGNALVSHLLWLFILIIIEMVLLFTAFKAWGKFARFAFRRNLVKRRGRGSARVRQLEAEINEAEENESHENGVYVYSSYIVIVNEGEKTVLNRAELQSVSAKLSPNKRWLELEFLSQSGEEKYSALVPYTDLPSMRRTFEGQLAVDELSIKKADKPEPMLFVLFGVVILIGVALMVLHFTVFNDMPLIFGEFFTAMGVLFIIIQFNRFAVIREGIVPLLASIIISTMIISAFSLIAQVQGLEFTFYYVFGVFDYKSVLIMFLAFMGMLFISGIAGTIKCIRHRK